MLHDLNPFIRFAKVITFSREELEASIAFDNRLFVCIDGEMSVSADEEYTLTADSAVFIPQYTPYRLHNLNCRIILFNFDLTAEHSDHFESLRTHSLCTWDKKELFRDKKLPPFDKTGQYDVIGLKQAFLRSAETFTSGEQYSRELASSYLKSGLIGMISAPEAQLHIAVRRFMEVANDRCDKDLTAAEAARCVGYHEVYLNRLVKAQLGVSVSEYIINRRIAKAKSLLDMGYSVTEASMMCGFSELSYFSRCFKKCEGITPREYGRVMGLL